jgi:hypothetical protein
MHLPPLIDLHLPITLIGSFTNQNAARGPAAKSDRRIWECREFIAAKEHDAGEPQPRSAAKLGDSNARRLSGPASKPERPCQNNLLRNGARPVTSPAEGNHPGYFYDEKTFVGRGTERTGGGLEPARA